MRYKGAAFLAIALALLVPSTQLATSQSAVASTAAPTSKLKPNMFQANSVRRGGRASGPGAGPSSATKKEIIGRRSRNSRTYQSGGNFETLIYPASINYQDAKGNWQPIDDTLVAASNPAYAYQNKANSYTAFFPANLAASPIHFTGQAGFVDISLVGARGAVAASHNQATYSNVLPGVSLSYAANADTLKESIRLDAPTAPNTFTFRLHTGPGLTARQMPGGAIEFLNAAGKPQYAFTLPYMYDSSNSAAGFSREVRMALGQDASGQTVTLTADPGWLKSNARKFPVTIDPSIGTNLNFYGGQDCFIQNTNPNTMELTR